MTIKFLKEQYIEVCVGFDDEEDPIMQEEKVSIGEVFEDVEIIDTIDDDIIQVQFGDGSVSFINRDSAEISE
jgi:hypothetical protein